MIAFRQKGFSLIELMVAIAIGMVLLAGISVAYLTSKTGFGYANNTARLAEDATFALEYIGRDVRMAGYAGCTGTQSQVNNAPATPATYTHTPSLTLITGQTLPATPNPFTSVTGVPSELFSARNAVYGFDSSNTAARTALGTSTAYSISTTNPILYFAGGSPYGAQLSADMTTKTNTLTITSKPTPWPNQNNMVFIVGDCDKSEVFQSTAVGTNTIDHPATANTSAEFSKLYLRDTLLTPLNTATYFIATRTGASTPSLYRRVFNGNSVTTEELVPNVEAMTFQYGENTLNNTGTDTSPTYQADAYRTTAGAVTDWSRVVSIRIGLIMVSDDDNITPSSSQSVEWLGGTYTSSTDRRLRRAYSTTVSIRNRMGL